MLLQCGYFCFKQRRGKTPDRIKEINLASLLDYILFFSNTVKDSEGNTIKYTYKNPPGF